MTTNPNPTTITAHPGSPFIDVVREFDATPAQLFRASTDPDLIVQWQKPYGVEMEIFEHDARPGGSYRYVHRTDTEEFYFRGVFHGVVPDELIVQTFEYEGAPHQVSLDTARFEDLSGRTRLHLHSVFTSVQARDAMVASGMESGIRDSMERLDEVLRPAGRVVVDISMSLDGYVTAPGVSLAAGLGVGGEALHDWAIGGKTARDDEILAASLDRTGAVIMGRNTFDIIDGPHGWTDEVGYAADHAPTAQPPVFVLTHSAPQRSRLGDRIRFVTDGLDSAVRQARAVAGEKDVFVMGGGDVCHQFLASGKADVLVLHLAPIVLGGGTRLFPATGGPRLRLELISSDTTDFAEHLTYRVSDDG